MVWIVEWPACRAVERLRGVSQSYPQRCAIEFCRTKELCLCRLMIPRCRVTVAILMIETLLYNRFGVSKRAMCRSTLPSIGKLTDMNRYGTTVERSQDFHRSLPNLLTELLLQPNLLVGKFYRVHVKSAILA